MNHLTEGFVAATKVTVFSNGPIRIEGDFEIVDQDGQKFGLGGRTAVTVCRCGHSGNSPFCDGTHKRQSFTSPISARDLPPPAPKA
ncbi:MAG: CDGSH iron-sulfur domain-containing protein [Candidatus Acidiferrum sp.]